MSHDIDDNGEENGQKRSPEEGLGVCIAAEHHQVDLHGLDQPGMEYAAEEYAENDTEYGQHNILAVHVLRNFQVVEAQYLNGSQLSSALCYVDIAQIVQYDHRQGSSAENDDDNYKINALHAVLVSITGVFNAGGTGNAADLHHVGKNTVAEGFVIGRQTQEVGVVLAFAAESAFVERGRNIDVMAKVMLGNTGDGNIPVTVVIESNGIANADVQKFAELLVDDNSLSLIILRPRITLSAPFGPYASVKSVTA